MGTECCRRLCTRGMPAANLAEIERTHAHLIHQASGCNNILLAISCPMLGPIHRRIAPAQPRLSPLVQRLHHAVNHLQDAQLVLQQQIVGS